MNFWLLSPALMALAWHAWRWPRRTVPLLVFLVPAYLLRTAIFGVPTNFWELGVIVLMAGAALRPKSVLFSQRLPRGSGLAIACLLASAIIAAAISAEPKVSLGILKGWFVVPMLFAWLAYQVKANQEELISSLVYSGAVSAGWALMAGGPRWQGWYDVPNSLALWLAPIFVLSLWQSLSRRTFTWYVSCLLIGLALVGTQSAMAIVSVLGAIAAWVLINSLSPRRTLIIIFFGLVILSCGYFAWSGRAVYLLQPWLDGQSNSVSVRWQLWRISWDLIKQQPWFGVGLGQFEPAYQARLHELIAQAPSAWLPEFVFRDPHNWILSFWLNVGALGLISFITMNLLALKNRPLNGPVLALICLLIFGLADTVYWKNDLAAQYWILFFLIIFPQTEAPQFEG